jgi:hypothetical protein
MTITTLPALDTVLLFDLIRWAEQDEAIDHAWWGTWDQSSWGWVMTDEEVKARRNGSCKTAYCMAGQAAHQAGYRLVFDYSDTITREIDMHDGTHFDGHVATASTCVPQRDTGRKNSKGYPIFEDVPGGEVEQVSIVGRQALGLTHAESDYFFEGDNGIDALKMMANRFCQDRGQPLLFPDWEVYDPDDYDPQDGDYGDDDDF